HQLNPAVARRPANRKRSVPHAQPRMPALFDINRRAPKAKDQEIPEALLCPRKVVARIHRPQQVVAGYLPVECRDEPPEPVLANRDVDFVIFQRPPQLISATLSSGLPLRSISSRIPGAGRCAITTCSAQSSISPGLPTISR